MKMYHGTRASFTRGGLLLPGDQVGKDNHNLSRSNVVYITTDLDLAWAYAAACEGRGKPKVLEVMPSSPPQVDDSLVNGEERDSYRCESATVIKVLAR